jgi:CRISPR-associated protein Cas2
MRYLLLYDIVHDGVRTKVADACLDYGLERIQYSAFLGELSRTHLRELWVQVEKRIGKSPARVHIYPLDEQSWSGRRLLEQMEKGDSL